MSTKRSQRSPPGSFEDVVAEWVGAHGAAYDLTLTGIAGGTWCDGEGTAVEPMTMDAIEFARTVSGHAAAEGVLAHGVLF